ncbi:Neurofibromin, partial [Leucoagaricus sp. SymC.cos]
PVHAHTLKYEKTHQSLVKSRTAVSSLITDYSGRIIFSISISNWGMVFERLRSKIRALANKTDEEVKSDLTDLQLLKYIVFDRNRLIQVLNELSSLLVNMAREAQLSIAVPLRSAIWNWIECHPNEFNETIRTRGKFEGAPERVLELFFVKMRVGSDEKVVWPTLTALCCMISEKMAKDFIQYSGRGYKVARKDLKFLDEVLKQASCPGVSKHWEVGLAAAVDLCRAAMFASAEDHEEIPIRLLAIDMAHEIKGALNSISQKLSGRSSVWEADEIDVVLYANVLVTVYRFLAPEESVPLIKEWLEPTRSDAVKICAVRACLTLAQEATLFPWQHSLTPLHATISKRTREIFKTLGHRRPELDTYGAMKHPSTRPKAKRAVSEPLITDKELLMLGILSLWRSDPNFHTTGATSAELEEWVGLVVKIWDMGVDNSVKVSTTIGLVRLAVALFRVGPERPHFELMSRLIKASLPTTLLSISVNLLRARDNIEIQRLWVSLALQVLELYCIKLEGQHVKEIQLDTDRLPAFIMFEIAFTVTLTSSNNTISQMAAKGLRNLANILRQPDAPMVELVEMEDWLKRARVYEQLGDPKVAVVGRVGHQKRIRKHLRLLAPCHAIDIVVWNECYKRWRLLTEPVLDVIRDPSKSGRAPAWKDQVRTLLLPFPSPSPTYHTTLPQDQKFQWHNLTLFMAAFGGVCLENAKEARNKLVSMIPYNYLPDELLSMETQIQPYLNMFLLDLNRILTVQDVATRDLAREALGAELSPRLYSRVVRYLDETTRMYEQEGPYEPSEEYLLFLEQFIAILKLILESQRYQEEKMSFDMSSTLLLLTNMVSRCVGPQTYRLRMKFCGLCDSVTSNTETCVLRKESPVRGNIIELLMEWMEISLQEANRDREVDEFNVACLKTFVAVLDKFQLRFTDALNAGDDTIHVISREFNKYSHMLLQFLEVYQPEHGVSAVSFVLPGSQHKDVEIREMVITGLANLVSANSEIGFKQCLPLAYDQDKRKKVIFAHVFARVIGQGTTFNAEGERSAAQSLFSLPSAIGDVTNFNGPKLALALTIVEVCPFSEDDMMISVMLNILDSRVPLTNFLKALIDYEIASATTESSLFRRNSVGNKFLSSFAKIHGYNYLRGLIGPLITFMKELPAGHSYEMDPSKAKEQDLVENQKTVEMIREISAYISHRVAEIWPTAKFSVMGAFIFLRFITPAIVSPETVDIELPIENGMTMRRGLMLIGKILQNLANNIFFGKEAHMTPLNRFLEGQIANVTRFLSEIHKSPPSAFESDDPWQGTISDDTDAIVLHRFLDRHADKIGKELLSMTKPTADGDPLALNGKRSWDELCALLVDLGTPVGTPELSMATSQDSIGYHELMTRYVEQSTTSVQDFFVETPQNDQDLVIFVLRLSKVDVEAIDIELLMYYILKTLNDSKYSGQSFDVIVDCTGFSSMSELPLQWLRFCAEIVPKDIRERFVTARVLNPNSLAQRYFRRLYNFLAGTAFCSSIKTYVSVAHILEELPDTVAEALSEPNALEQEPYDEFQDVTWKQFNSMRIPVTLRVASSHIRITSRQRQPVSPVLACRNVEIIHLADIGDIYNIFTGQDMNEFIVRRRQGSTTYFFSALRDPIVKAIRHAKGKLKDAHIHISERFSRFSNVPATLLHIGFLSVDPEDETMRGAAYHLLGAVCTYLKYDKSPILAAQAGVIPTDPIAFVMQLSEKLAEFAPQLTLDFIHEVSASLKAVGRESIPNGQCTACIYYLSPWIRNLAHFVNPTHSLYERSGARVRDCIRTLAELSVTFPMITPSLQRCIWAEISKSDNVIVDAVLDELIRTASDGGVNNPRCEAICHIVSTISSINVRGRVYHKLRKALNRPPTHVANNVSQHANYSEISTLVKLCLVVGSQSRQLSQNQLYVPEIVHIVMLVAADGPMQVRKSVYGIILNLLQSLYVSRTDDMPATELLQIIKDYASPATLKLFGLQRHVPTSKHTLWTPQSDKQYLDNLEQLAFIHEVSASLKAVGRESIPNGQCTACIYYLSPWIRNLAHFVNPTHSLYERSDNVIVDAVLDELIRTASDGGVNNPRCEAICHIVSTISSINVRGRVYHKLPEQLDRLLKFSFESSFSFTLAAVIFKGMRVRHLKEYAEAALKTLLRVTVKSERDPDATKAMRSSPSNSVLGYFLALLPAATTLDTYRNLIRECDIGEAWHIDAGLPELDAQVHVPQVTHTFLSVSDPQTALFLATFAGTMLSSSQGDDAESEMLYLLLADLGHSYPDIVSLVFGNIQDKVINAFNSSSNPAILRYVSSIYRVSQPDTPGMNSHENVSTSTLGTIDEGLATPALLSALEAHNMQGLAQSLQFLPLQHGYATKMINWIASLVDLMI